MLLQSILFVVIGGAIGYGYSSTEDTFSNISTTKNNKNFGLKKTFNLQKQMH